MVKTPGIPTRTIEWATAVNIGPQNPLLPKTTISSRVWRDMGSNDKRDNSQGRLEFDERGDGIGTEKEGGGRVVDISSSLKRSVSRISSRGLAAPDSGSPCKYCGAAASERVRGCESGNAPEGSPGDPTMALVSAPRYMRCPNAAEMDRRQRVRRHAEISGTGYLGIHQTFENFDARRCKDPNTADLPEKLLGLLDDLAEREDPERKPGAESFSEARMEAPSQPRAPGVMILGGPGCGKSHLLRATAIAACERGLPARFVESHRLVRRITETYSNRSRGHQGGEEPLTASEIMEQLAQAEVVCIDDLASEQETEHTIQILFEILDILVSSQRMAVISTNLEEEEIQGRYGDRVLSRLGELCELWTLAKEPDHRSGAVASGDERGSE